MTIYTLDYNQFLLELPDHPVLTTLHQTFSVLKCTEDTRTDNTILFEFKKNGIPPNKNIRKIKLHIIKLTFYQTDLYT